MMRFSAPTSAPTAPAAKLKAVSAVKSDDKAAIKVNPDEKEKTDQEKSQKIWIFVILLLLVLCLLYIFCITCIRPWNDKDGNDSGKSADREEVARDIASLMAVSQQDLEAFHAMQATLAPVERVQPARQKMAEDKKKARLLEDQSRYMDDEEMSARADELAYLQKELQQALDAPDRGPVNSPAMDASLQDAVASRSHKLLQEAVNIANREIQAGKIVVPPSLAQARKVLQDMDRAASHKYVGPKGTRQIEDFFRGRPALDADANYHRKNSELK